MNHVMSLIFEFKKSLGLPANYPMNEVMNARLMEWLKDRMRIELSFPKKICSEPLFQRLCKEEITELRDDILHAIIEKSKDLDVEDIESHIWYGKFEDFINDYFSTKIFYSS